MNLPYIFHEPSIHMNITMQRPPTPVPPRSPFPVHLVESFDQHPAVLYTSNDPPHAGKPWVEKGVR